jgi:uracil-DNA glycosylase
VSGQPPPEWTPGTPQALRPAPRGPARPGGDWPDEPATATTPVAHDGAEVARLAATAPSLAHLGGRISMCRACPRLVAWREKVITEPRASFREERYWGRPVPGFGVERPRIVLLGLAPAAHGGNRTGRVFTGDRSGDFLFAAMHRAGLATQPTSTDAGDGLRLIRSRVLAAVRCAPPANKPSNTERETCSPWLAAELAAVRQSARVLVALGGFAWQAAFPALEAAGYPGMRGKRPDFAHGREERTRELTVLGCYHPSQQNTFTGRLTEEMFDTVLARALELAG